MLSYKAKRSLACWGLFCAALLLSSCGRAKVTSPLSDPDDAKPDERLFGMWKPATKGENASDNVYLFIGKFDRGGAPAGIMKAVLLGLDKQNNLGDMTLFFFSTLSGKNSYANLFGEEAFGSPKSPAWNKKDIADLLIYKYKVDDNKLTLWSLDDDAVEAAVRNGQVKGKIERKGNSKQSVVTLSDGEDLLRYLKEGGDDKLFNDKHKDVFYRVK